MSITQQPQPQVPPPDPSRTRFLFTHRCPRCRNIPPANVDVVHDETGEVSCLLERGYKLRWWSDTNEIECACGETFMCPERLSIKTPKTAKKSVEKAKPAYKSKPTKEKSKSTDKKPAKKSKSTDKKQVKKSKQKSVAVKSKPKPKRNPEPQSYKDHILQFDADPLEGIINADCRGFLQSVFCPGSGFRAIASMGHRTKAHYLADIGNRSFHLEPIQKDLLEFLRRSALGTADDKLIDELTSKQHCYKFIRDTMVSVHKDWNASELSDQLREAYSKELSNKPQWAEKLTGEQSLDFIYQLTGKNIKIAALRKMAERKHNLKVPKRNDRYFRDSIVEHYG